MRTVEESVWLAPGIQGTVNVHESGDSYWVEVKVPINFLKETGLTEDELNRAESNFREESFVDTAMIKYNVDNEGGNGDWDSETFGFVTHAYWSEDLFQGVGRVLSKADRLVQALRTQEFGRFVKGVLK